MTQQCRKMSDMSKPQPGPYSQQPTAPVYQAQPGYGPSPGSLTKTKLIGMID